MKIFSFCIFGVFKKYCLGLVRNIEQISALFPGWEIWITVGNDVPVEYLQKYQSFANVRLFPQTFTGGRLMSHRFFFIDDPTVEIMLVRDSDSRMTPRDKWCIDEFLNGPYKLFTIRDHHYHTREIMGGQWGIKKFTDTPWMKEAYNTFCKSFESIDAYESDQIFLKTFVYNQHKDKFIAFSTTLFYSSGEAHKVITMPRKDEHDFCGNVVSFRTGSDGKDEEFYVF